MSQSNKQSINEPINQSINQSTNQSINQSINQSFNQFGHSGQDVGHSGQDVGHSGQDFGHSGQDFGHSGQDFGDPGQDFGDSAGAGFLRTLSNSTFSDWHCLTTFIVATRRNPPREERGARLRARACVHAHLPPTRRRRAAATCRKYSFLYVCAVLHTWDAIPPVAAPAAAPL